MATITASNEINVLGKFEKLVRSSLGSESAYIRAKETIKELFQEGTLTDSDRAQVVSSVVGSMVNGITTASMTTALEWAKVEKEIELEKLKLAWQIDTLEQESLLKAAQVAQAESANRLAKVESKRLYGTAVFDAQDNIISLADEGKVFAEISLTNANTSKTAEEELLTTQKISESYAAVHKIIADTYVNYGNYTYSAVTAGGITGVVPQHGAFKTLSDTQQDIAIEQAKGYTYNAWANALTGSASMLGTAIAAEYAEFTAGTGAGGTNPPGYDLLQNVLTTAGNLKNATLPV